MRLAITAFCILALAACSSTPTEPESTEPAVSEAGAPEAAPTTTTTTEPADTTTSMAADSGGGDSMVPIPEGGEFPPIEGTERTMANCTRGSDTRIVTVIDRTGGGCGVVYTKHGNKKTVAMANYDMGYCDKVFENIKGNLANAGYDCGGGGAAQPTSEENSN